MNLCGLRDENTGKSGYEGIADNRAVELMFDVAKVRFDCHDNVVKKQD